MSLATTTTTTRLELLWQRQTRRHSPTRRWGATHPVLAVAVDEIRDRLADGDRDRSGPTLAALVHLAVDGDTDAALLVTLALLSRMVAAERARGRYDYDALAGHLWEAVVTTSNPHTRCLRETIERNTWRRHWRDGRQDERADLVDFGRGDLCTVRTRSKRVTTSPRTRHNKTRGGPCSAHRGDHPSATAQSRARRARHDPPSLSRPAESMLPYVPS